MKKKIKKINAAILIIGNEILSGRTQDKNIAFICDWLNANCGISVTEAKIIPDDEKTIVKNIQALSKKGIRLFISSNSHPDNLYKDGLQRSKFLKTIDLINEQFLVHNLLGNTDYRLAEIAKFDSSAEDKNSNECVKDFLQETFDIDIVNTTQFLVNDRKFNCLGCSERVLWLSFDDFFSSPCASKDFLEIVKTFEWIFINNFHTCNDDHIDKLRRFISFIDIAYQEKQKLKLFYDPNLKNNLYSGDQLHHLWVRTESRLNQISTRKYLQNLEKN